MYTRSLWKNKTMMDKFFNEQSQKIGIILSKEVIEDPIYKNKTHTELNPLPIRAIVTDLIFSQISWKMPGISTSKAKEILIEKKRESLLLQSYQIVIDGEKYNGWKVGGKLQYRRVGDYIKVYCYIKKEQ